MATSKTAAPAATSAALVAKLVYKKSTPGKHVYEETGDPADHLLGSVYVPKRAAATIGLTGKPGEKATVLVEKGWTV